MDFTAYILVSFLLFMITLGLFGYFLYLYLKLPEVTPPPLVLDPNVVVCDSNQVLDAYVFGYPNKPGCPAWTNDLLVAEDYRLYLRDFIASPDCCYFSNQPQEKKLIPRPFICVAKEGKPAFTLQQLNANPYVTNGLTVSYTVPACNGVENCFSLVQSDGKYILYSYTGKLDINPADWTFQLSDSCLTLTQVAYQGALVGEVRNGSFVYLVPESTVPQSIRTLVSSFTLNGGAPMAGLNPNYS